MTIGPHKMFTVVFAVALLLTGATACSSSKPLPQGPGTLRAAEATPTPTSTYVPPFRIPSAAQTAMFLHSLRSLAGEPGMARFSAKDTTDSQLAEIAKGTCIGLYGDEPLSASVLALTVSGWSKPMAVAMLRAAVAPGSFCPQRYASVDEWLRRTSDAA